MKKTIIGKLRFFASATLALIATLLPIVTTAQIPDQPTPPTLVNDFAQLLTYEQKNALERRLVAYDDTTSTQITVITVTDLEGLPIAEYAQQLGEKWGVGVKGKDNGVVLIVKPKTSDSSGEAFIAPGYGLEGALPDITCRRIVTDRMIPHFKENDYAGGINVGVEAIAQAAIGDFHDAREYDDNDDLYVTACFLIIVILLVILYFAGNYYIDRYQKAETRREKITTTMTFFFILATIYTTITGVLFRILVALGARSSDSDGSYSSGDSSRGDSFGGFGGGSFGGGGGGGRW